MGERVSLAINWAAACGGCDVALLDLEQALLDLAAAADVVFWPVALDFKRTDLEALPDGSVDFGLFNGAVRTAEQEQDARLLRRKSKTLVALGSCACFGGVPSLANAAAPEALLDTVYKETASTDNPDGTLPGPAAAPGALPELLDRVSALHQIVDVDVFAPGCPPTPERLVDLVGVVRAVIAGEPAPPKGTILASDRGLCEECPRAKTRGRSGVDRFVRVHEVAADPDRCLLDQGIVCAGIATRGGCGARCIAANMPCRGCFGPLPAQRDGGAELASALAALSGPRGNWEMPVHAIVSPARSVVDPAGTFYRFTYAASLGRGPGRDGRG